MEVLAGSAPVLYSVYSDGDSQMNLAAITSLGQRVLNTARQGFSHLKESLSNLRSAEAGSDDSDLEVKEHLSEKGLSVHLLRVSVLAVAFKALHYFVNRKYFWFCLCALILSSFRWVHSRYRRTLSSVLSVESSTQTKFHLVTHVNVSFAQLFHIEKNSTAIRSSKPYVSFLVYLYTSYVAEVASFTVTDSQLLGSEESYCF